MKFIHLADVHLGDNFNLNETLAKKVRSYSKKSLKKIFNANKDVDFALIAGDLFERSYFSSRDFKELFEIFEDFSKDIYYVSGNHDYFDDFTRIFLKNAPSNLHVFGSETMEMFESQNIRVYGISYGDRIFDKKISLNIDLDDDFFNIFLIHSDYNINNSRYFNLNKADIQKLSFDYIALGHIHKRNSILKAYYPGSIEPHDFTDVYEYGYIRYEDGRANFIDSSILKFWNFDLNMKDFSSLEELALYINKKISKDKKNLIRITIKTEDPIDTRKLKEEIKAYYLDIRQEEDLSYQNLVTLYPNSLVEKFYQKFEGKDDAIHKLARDLGLEAIFRSKYD
ncbi:MAG: metallophosphoesterase family protein [Anaerococcus sp.]|nr:metallophosphoesterase family protein [Anaerococcus sp.]